MERKQPGIYKHFIPNGINVSTKRCAQNKKFDLCFTTSSLKPLRDLVTETGTIR